MLGSASGRVRKLTAVLMLTTLDQRDVSQFCALQTYCTSHVVWRIVTVCLFSSFTLMLVDLRVNAW